MPRYKPVHRNPVLLPVVLADQIHPGTFESALDHLVDKEIGAENRRADEEVPEVLSSQG